MAKSYLTLCARHYSSFLGDNSEQDITITAYSGGNFIRWQIVIHAVEKSEVGKGVRQSEIGNGMPF